MSVPKYYEFMKPVLHCLSDGKVHSVKEIYQCVAEITKLTIEDKNERINSGQLTYMNRIGWARTYLLKAQLIERVSRAMYAITTIGLNEYHDSPDCITKDYLMKYDSFKSFQTFVSTDLESEIEQSTYNGVKDTDPQQILEDAYVQIQRTLKDELLTTIMSQSPDFFESLSVKLLDKMGYGGYDSKVTQHSRDEGIDGVVKEDKLGFDTIYVQAKRWDRGNKVGRKILQEFVGALDNGSKGIFITTSEFTKDAKEYATDTHAKKGVKLILIDGYKLVDLMVEYELGVSESTSYKVMKVDYDFFNEE